MSCRQEILNKREVGNLLGGKGGGLFCVHWWMLNQRNIQSNRAAGCGIINLFFFLFAKLIIPAISACQIEMY